MATDVNASGILESNRKYHDEVEALDYDVRMGIRHTKDDVKQLVNELEDVLGEPLPVGVHVADLGAGTGNVAIKLAIDGRFSKVTAVDISARMLEVAEKSAQANNCEIETIVSDMTRLPFDDNSVDMVVGCAILHHVPDPERFIAEIHRVLKPGGPVIIIGEPSKIGVRLETVLKLPAILAVRAYRMITGREVRIWEHDLIDVHTFDVGQIRNMSKQYTSVRFRCEGFLEPLMDQGVLVLVRRALSIVPGVETVSKYILKAMGSIDRAILNRVMPQSLLVVIKFAGRK